MVLMFVLSFIITFCLISALLMIKESRKQKKFSDLSSRQQRRRIHESTLTNLQSLHANNQDSVSNRVRHQSEIRKPLNIAVDPPNNNLLDVENINIPALNEISFVEHDSVDDLSVSEESDNENIRINFDLK